jgi:hypothetical protein
MDDDLRTHTMSTPADRACARLFIRPRGVRQVFVLASGTVVAEPAVVRTVLLKWCGHRAAARLQSSRDALQQHDSARSDRP